MPNANQVSDLRQRFRDAWSNFLDHNGRFHSSKTLDLLKSLRCIKTTINVGTKEKPRLVDFWGTPNDVVFLLQAFGHDSGTQARGVYLDYTQFEEWYINQCLGFQGQKLNYLLERHTLGRPRLGYHRLPPGNVLFGNSTKASGAPIKDLVEGNFMLGEEKRSNVQWPPRKSGAAGDDGRRHGSQTDKNKDDLWLLMSYGYGRTMGDGPEHSYAPVEGKRPPGRLPQPRPTIASTLTANAAKATARGIPPRPQSAKTDVSWKLPQFTETAAARTRLDGKPLYYEQLFPSGPARPGSALAPLAGSMRPQVAAMVVSGSGALPPRQRGSVSTTGSRRPQSARA